MNSFNLSRLWFSFAYENTNVRPVHTALYFWIVERANASGWKKIIDIQTEKSMECLGITDWRTYKNALEFLVQSGFIIWLEKSKNQFTCNRISLIENPSEISETFKNAYAQNAEPNAEAIAEAIVEAFAEAHVEAIAEALQSYINLKTLKPKNPKTSKPSISSTPLFPEENHKGDSPERQKPKEKSSAKKEKVQPHFFHESPYYDQEKFTSYFSPEQYPRREHPNTDIEHYYSKLKHWAEYGSGKKPGAQKSKDWLCTARTFMSRDEDEGKLKMKGAMPTSKIQERVGVMQQVMSSRKYDEHGNRIKESP